MNPSSSKSDFPPEEAYRRSKVSHFFDLVDLNKDGAVEEEDFIEWGRQAANCVGVEYTPELAGHWKNSYRVYFADNAGYDKGKYLQAMIDWSNMDNSVAMAAEINIPLMKAIDANRDGTVSYEEFYAFLKPLGTEDSAREAFDLIDLDGSGTLDAKELAEACARYFCDKEESPYENIFGRIPKSSDGN